MSEPLVYVANPSRTDGPIAMVMPQFRNDGTDPVIECSGFVLGGPVDLVKAIVLPVDASIPATPPQNSIAATPQRVEEVQDEPIYTWQFAQEERDGERRDQRLPVRMGMDNRLVVYARIAGTWYLATNISQLFVLVGASGPVRFNFGVRTPSTDVDIIAATLKTSASGLIIPVTALRQASPPFQALAASIRPTEPQSDPDSSTDWTVRYYPSMIFTAPLEVPNGQVGRNRLWVKGKAYWSNEWTQADQYPVDFKVR